MTSLRSLCAAAALTALVMGPTQPFAMTTDYATAGINAVTAADRPSTPTAPLIKVSGPGELFGVDDFSFDIKQMIYIGQGEPVRRT
jgi:hypothetical protein